MLPSLDEEPSVRKARLVLPEDWRALDDHLRAAGRVALAIDGGSANCSVARCAFGPAVSGAALRVAGHDVEVVAPFSDLMGHAGALVRSPNGIIEAGADPRSDGTAAGY